MSNLQVGAVAEYIPTGETVTLIKPLESLLGTYWKVGTPTGERKVKEAELFVRAAQPGPSVCDYCTAAMQSDYEDYRRSGLLSLSITSQ